ncbi:unnamed protein product [Orchesella dallaii]|uniref:Uncharacterized protein n=1 Tax=Orchesella dallaii TaxID=48710 RepID=A0ABP1RZ08_9HEXA
MVDKKRRNPGKNVKPKEPVRLNVSSDEEEDHQPQTSIVVNRFTDADDSISKMYRDIDDRSRTPTLAEELWPWLQQGYWDDPKCIKLGYLFRFNYHHNVARRRSEITMKKDNIGAKPSVFVWDATDTPKFLSDVLIPIEEECSRTPPEDLFKNVDPKYLEPEMTDEEFFVQGITKTSPGGEIKIRPFIRRLTKSKKESIGVFIRWFMEVPKPVFSKSRTFEKEQETEWTGYHLTVDLPTFRLILGRIPLIYGAYLEGMKKRVTDTSTDHTGEDEDECC